MERALIIGASGGIGRAVADALEARGVAVTRLSRAVDGLDVTDEASVARLMAPLEGPFELVFVAVGVLALPGQAPEKAVAALTAEALAGVFAVNAIGPALVLKHVLRLVPKDRRAVVAVLSARVGSIGDNRIGGWHAYRASKAALNQIVHGTAIEMKRTHRQAICVALHPGTVQTPFTANYSGHSMVTPESAAANLLAVIEGLERDQSGGFYDWAGEDVPW
ncbi:MAG: SDR family NAD(P)-dependent oxidoreductase [Flavimaricola sp.]|nr:SDR family NAD(P)-dependent oxidoreductase [Flavimaricola sp.]